MRTGLPGAKHCNSVWTNVWRKVVFSARGHRITHFRFDFLRSGGCLMLACWNCKFVWQSLVNIACEQTITKLWLVPSAKQRRDPCSGPPTDSTNYRKCVSNSPSNWLAITTNKTKAFFNWPIVARTQIWVHSWKSRTRISALFRRRS